MLKDWLTDALHAANLTHGDLATILSKRLNRTIERTAVTRMASGDRKISGEELVAISEYCNYPLPGSFEKYAVFGLTPKEYYPKGLVLVELEDLCEKAQVAIRRMFPTLSAEACCNMAWIFVYELEKSRSLRVLVDRDPNGELGLTGKVIKSPLD